MENDYKNMTRNILYPAADMPATWSTLCHDHTCYGHGRCSTPVADTRNVSLFACKPHIFITNLTKYWAEFPHPLLLQVSLSSIPLGPWSKESGSDDYLASVGSWADVRKLPVFRKLDYVISHLFCVQIWLSWPSHWASATVR